MNLKSTTDQQLVKNILKGKPRAFEILIKSTEGLVAQIIYKMVNNAEDRKDLAQEVYLKVYRNLSRFKFQAKLSTWVGQIAYNSCVDYLNKKKLMLLDDKLEPLVNKNKDLHSDDLHSWLHNRDLSTIIELAMEEIFPLHKTILTLFHQEGLSYKEIGEITGLPEGTLKSYLFRARRKLRDSILRRYKKEDL